MFIKDLSWGSEAFKKIYRHHETHDKILIVDKTVFCFFTCESTKSLFLIWDLKRSLMYHV